MIRSLPYCALSFVFFFLELAVGRAQTIFYVSTTGTSSPASATTSWATSTTDLQGAIQASQSGDEVWVAAGTYKPGGDTNRDQTLSFALKNGVKVLGGFPASGSPTLAQRNPRTNPTILSGDLDNDGTPTGNSYHIVYLPDGLALNTTAQLDGFELTGGNAANLARINTEMQAVQGGAVYVENSSPLFLNCVFRNNRAGGCGMFGCYGYGGAVGNAGGSPGFVNCTFTDNSAVGQGGQGGVIYSTNGSPTFTNCSFQGNSAGGAGGVYYESSLPLQFMNCSFQGNSSVGDGFVGVTNSMSWPNNGAALTNCVFWNNGGSRAFTYYDAAQAVLSHSLLESWADVLFGPGIQYATSTPFVSTTSTSLNGCTPALGAANVTSYTASFGGMAASPQSDELGNARFRNGTLDMGARQFEGAPTELLMLISQPPASTIVTVNTQVMVPFSVTSGGTINYQWYRFDANGIPTLLATQNSASLSLASVQFADAGRYIAVASITGGCSLTSTAFQLIVEPIYSLTVTVAAHPSLTVTQGATVTLTASGADSYAWNTGFVGNPLIAPINTASVISVSGLTGINGGIASVTLTTVSVSCRSVIYVSETGSGIQDGSSWTNAIAGRNLQLAINAAQSCGGQVWVASGLYKPTTDANRAVSFTMKPGVAIYGGFVGGETSLSQRPALNPNTGQPSSSTLSGDIGTLNSSTDNSYHVIYNNPGLTNTAILDGFVVVGGRADVFGGGMFNNGTGVGQVCNPTVRNCSFIDNAAVFGGGVWNQASNGGTSSPRFETTYFERNRATNLGGAFYNQPDPNGTTSGTLINCSFVNNTAGSDGGAVYNNGYGGGRAFPLLLNCAFISNTATRGGAMFTIGFTGGRSLPSLINCSFLGNTAASGGGAMFNNPISGTAAALLTNCVFWNNGGSAALTPGSTFTANTSLLEAPLANGAGNLLAGVTPFASTTGVALNTCAPAINTGDLSAYNTLNGPATDLAGNARFRNGLLDMGAQQFMGTLGAVVTITNQPPASLTINAGDDLTVPISATSHGGLTYQWFNGGTGLSGQTSATLSIPNAQTVDSGTYVVSVSATGGCSTTSTVLHLTVNPSDRPFLNVTVSPSGTITTGVAVTLTVSGAASYTWANGAQGNQLVINPVSTTALSVTGTNDLGFTGMTTQTITVVPIPCQSILYVTQNGAGGQTGSSWGNAIAGRNLQHAINAAQACGGQVWVASGTYKPSANDDRTASFNMRPGVAIYGGFVGSEDALSDRPAMNPANGQPSSSTLSGEIGDPNSTTDNSFHVVYNSNGITSTAIFDGFVVTGGRATDFGGGMYNNANQVTLSIARWVCSPTVRNVLFTNNYAPSGGAVFNDSRVHGTTNPLFQNTAFVSNTAVLGGAIHNATYNYGTANFRAINCFFERNTAAQGGVFYSNGDAGGVTSFSVINGAFLNNSATTAGGVMYNYARLIGEVTPFFVNCSFQGNSSVSFNNQSVPNGFVPGTTLPTFINSVFWNNGGANALTALGQTYVAHTCSLEPDLGNVQGDGNEAEFSNPFSSPTNLQLNPCSKAIGTANSAAYNAASGPATDLTGSPRFTSGRLDRGAVQGGTLILPVGITAGPPAGSVVCLGGTIKVPVSVSGTGTLSYQWYKEGPSGTPITLGAAQSSSALQLSNGQLTDAGSYSVVVTGACNSVTSTGFSLSVVGAPQISLQASMTTLSCSSPSAVLMANPGFANYTFSGPGLNQSGPANQATASQPGVFSVSATTGLCSATATVSLRGGSGVGQNALLLGSGSLSCQTPTLTLTASGGSLYTFSGPGVVSQTNGRETIIVGNYIINRTPIPTVGTAVVNKPGTYTVVVQGPNGCTATATLLVTGIACQ